MYLFVPQLKNRQIEIEHGCFLPIGRRPSGCMAGRMHVLIESIATVMRFTSDKIQLIIQKI